MDNSSGTILMLSPLLVSREMQTTIPRIHKTAIFTLATTEACGVQIHEFLSLQIAKMVATIAMDPRNLVEEGTLPTIQVRAE